jgi:hypothetical protein
MNKFKKVSENFQNQYFLRLSIIDHLREILNLYDNEFKINKKFYNYYKELTDLKILLDILFKNDILLQELYVKRIDKFIENINKNI